MSFNYTFQISQVGKGWKIVQFATRNSLVLGILLVVVVLVGVYWTEMRQPERLRSINEEIRKIDLELANTPDLLGQYNAVSAELTHWEKRWNERSKDIPTQDITVETNAYFNSVILSSGQVKVDVQYLGTQHEPKFGYSNYSLRGEGLFPSLYRFISYLENGRRLFKFNKLTFREIMAKEAGEQDAHPSVQYELELRAYFTSLAELSSSVGWRDVGIEPPPVDPFWPLVRTETPRNVKNLVEVERSKLTAVIPGKAFIIDQAGKLRTLRRGDKVYLGYVSKIIHEKGKVKFVLNKGGIIEPVVLKVQYRQSPDDSVK